MVVISLIIDSYINYAYNVCIKYIFQNRLNLSMLINWSKAKNEILKKTRNVSFEQAEEEILKGRIVNQFEHPNKEKYRNQIIFILEIDGYICQIPAVISSTEIFLKTIFKSRKYNKRCKK